jgi:hypothetical protein
LLIAATNEALRQLVEEIEEDANTALTEELKSLRLEITALNEALAEAKTVIAQMKAVMDSDRAKVVDLPPLRARAN